MLKDDIRFLGVSGGRDYRHGCTSLQVSSHVVIDAGNLIEGLRDELSEVEHIFLTHSHLDHIIDIVFLVDNLYDTLDKPIKIYGHKHTLQALRDHLFNDTIWPDFTHIKLKNSAKTAVEFVEISPGDSYAFADVTLTPILADHTVTTYAYLIEKPSFKALFATDTHLTPALWSIINHDSGIDSLIVDISFPSRMDALAQASKHLTPKSLKMQMQHAFRPIDLYMMHIKPAFEEEIGKELKAYGLLEGKSRLLKAGEYLKNLKWNQNRHSMMDISIALSKEKDLGKILEMILKKIINYTRSEGGTIYLKSDNALHFKSLINTKLNIAINDPDYPSIKLFQNGQENYENVSAICALKKRTIAIPDVYFYNMDGVSFEGVKRFDEANGYRTASMLVIPMIDHDDDVIGVIQLINKKVGNYYGQFSQDDIKTASTYANWAATAITKNRLIDDLEALFLSFLESISVAMSAKSPYGNDHISRVADLMRTISKKINEDNGVFREVHYNEDELKALEIAAWMHDIGKISTPDYLLDKSTRLETVYDRIAEIESRFDYVMSLIEIAHLNEKIALLEDGDRDRLSEIQHRYEQKIAQMASDKAFLRRINAQEKPLSDEDIERINRIAQERYDDKGETKMLLSEQEREMLSTRRGTFTDAEREKVNEHAKVSFEMMDRLPFPKKYRRVKEIACAHHEKLNGTGYPMGLKGDEISFEGRLMAIVDIFEALTANDRAYKTPKTVSETFAILESMAKRGEIDAEIVSFIKESRAYESYAKRNLKEEQYRESVDSI